MPCATDSPTASPMREERLTEQRNPRSKEIDRLSPLEIVDLINDEDGEVSRAVGRERVAIAKAIGLVADSIGAGGRLIYVGAGTSGRLGVLDAAEMPPTFGTDPEMVQGVIAGGPEALVRAQEGAEDAPADGALAMDGRNVGPADFVLGIATSGTTPFVHGALTRARERGARTGILLCTPPGPELAGRHDVVIAPLVGPEVITGSTRMKAGTATKMVLNTITTGAMVLLGKVYGNLMVDLQVTCQKLQDRGERILMETLEVDRDGARDLLEGAGGNVKTAIVMGKAGSWSGRGAASPERGPGIGLTDRGGLPVRLLGLMSGTSLDGIDVALLEVEERFPRPNPPRGFPSFVGSFRPTDPIPSPLPSGRPSRKRWWRVLRGIWGFCIRIWGSCSQQLSWSFWTRRGSPPRASPPWDPTVKHSGTSPPARGSAAALFSWDARPPLPNGPESGS